ncbi:MAG: hypothetical protein HY391_01675 [Deltaproteobacteria bacterium]|nr:hypothetical protein [Deltaproteobacteria bacterium]
MKRLALFLVVIGFASRFLPHLPNFTALGAVTLFSGFYLRGRERWLVPFAVMLLSDVILNFAIYRMGFAPDQLMVYAAIGLNILLAGSLAGQSLGKRLLYGVPLSSFNFFLLTNFGVWLWSGLYARTLPGLVQCYVAAIPFLGYEFFSNAIYSLALFSAYELVHHWKFSRLSVTAW